MTFTTRCSAAIVQGSLLLLVKDVDLASGESYWILPGGGREAGETDEEATRREVREETGLEISVEGILEDVSIAGRGKYDRYITFLCRPISGQERLESEPKEASEHCLKAIRWLDLSNKGDWEPDLRDDPVMGPLLQKICLALSIG